MEVLVKVTESTKGKTSIIIKGFRFRIDYTSKSGDIAWRCVQRNCRARIKTTSDKATMVSQTNDHNHDSNERMNEKIELIARTKRKAVEDISARPSKLIRQELQFMQESSLQPKDIVATRKAIYRVRQKVQPIRPKAREECHTLLSQQ